MITIKRNYGNSMLTERYTVVLFGVDTKYYTKEFVAFVWDESANKEYNNSQIYITARINADTLVCGDIRECSLGDTAYVITTARNPAEAEDAEAFRNSYLNVLNDVRQRLENPSMTITIDNVDYFYFI